MKGIEILTIALIGFVVIAFVIFWSVSELGIGRQGIVLSREISDADASISSIESSKRSLKESVSLSSNMASLQIAASGGSYGNERLWWCNNNPVPPESIEVLWSLSNKTSSFFQIYAGKAESLIESNITGYGCIKISYPNECKRFPCAYWNAS